MPDSRPLSLGKKRPTYDKRDLQLIDFLNVSTALPHVPATFAHGKTLTYSMLGNGPDPTAPGKAKDGAGDCTCAGTCNETRISAHDGGGTQPAFTGLEAINLYSAITGYDPATGANDNGAEVREVMAYRKAHGVKDASGTVHRIEGYLSVEPGDHAALLTGAWLFEAAGIGIEFPDSAMDQFDAGKPWSVVSNQQPTEGHYVPLVGHWGGYFRVVTWGRIQAVTAGFLNRYNDESWIPLMPEQFAKASGKNVEGYNDAALKAFLKTKGI